MTLEKNNTQFSRLLALSFFVIVAIFMVIIGIIIFEANKLTRTTDLIKDLHMPSTQETQKLTTGI